MKLLINQKKLQGHVYVPGDKSISHRSIMFGAIAHGQTRVKGFLEAEDCLSTLHLFRSLGVEIVHEGTDVLVNGCGIESFKQPKVPIDIGNSGTTIRLATGLLAGGPVDVTLYGDASIAKRPMGRVLTPLKEMNASVSTQDGNYAPIHIKGNQTLTGIRYQMPVASAQVKSALLLAGLHAKGETTVIEKEKTRDHTEDMIKQFGGKLEVTGKVIRLKGPQRLIAQTVVVPGDISSAAFFMVAGLITKESQIVLPNVGISATRTGIIDVIRQMNGHLTITNEDKLNKSATLTVTNSSLKATTVEGKLIPRLIDELPIIALLATQASGTTVIRNAEELKVKETNRIDVTASELNKMGANIETTSDGLIIHGPTPLHAAVVDSHGDHRIGMMLAIASLLVETGQVELKNSEAVAVSYPRFFEDLASLIGEKQ
ncbi:3-phosphoshikimate 1-carboxyvinyltransferase [Vagococcus xieshaowenii]|uniref:3-phosphoshikimate 1-carboxyvinyltransferase n=1 Tax=Vagococcus xieshaowenii TaxID=2562451 RepID=A0AAJ5JM88_9ENTE|nr:3-phosphoshikimate 1-carboxyvinyltransferase [Vagococcus xieshaowenii]QCA28469.1 3-phosphoshikimate 1-carboxyvinyltransferase [Vagococcus xieshaowenii]TFZ42776.1 3-phosphoshikimate 1-carboxyvinyltransferase [Vagococcus xieshaowenii]